MTDFLLVVRSGQTAFDREGRIKGTLDIPLTEEGKQEAKRFGDDVARFAPSALVASPSRCARETAAAVGASTGLKPRICPELGNLDFGLWQGLLVEEIAERQPKLHRQGQENPWALMPPEGEALEECCDRASTAIERLLRRHGEGPLALVVPEPLGRIIRWVVAGESFGNLWQPDRDEPAVRRLPLAAQWSASAGDRSWFAGRR
jgi:probable phosphoglycerate mutase